MPVTWWTVTLAALVTAIATGLGAVPFFFMRRPRRTSLGVANAAAAGLMLAASLMLFYEGGIIGVGRTLLGALLGAGFIAVSQRWLEGRHELRWGALQGADALKALMIMGVMLAHSFTEGVGVGVSYGGGDALGIFITIAIAVHNIPEGLAISLVLIPRGTPVWKAAAWSVVSSLPQPFMALPAFLFVEVFREVLPVGLGFAGGAMVWMCYRELLPDALEEASRPVVASVTTAAAVAMLVFQWLLKGE